MCSRDYSFLEASRKVRGPTMFLIQAHSLDIRVAESKTGLQIVQYCNGAKIHENSALMTELSGYKGIRIRVNRYVYSYTKQEDPYILTEQTLITLYFAYYIVNPIIKKPIR